MASVIDDQVPGGLRLAAGRISLHVLRAVVDGQEQGQGTSVEIKDHCQAYGHPAESVMRKRGEFREERGVSSIVRAAFGVRVVRPPPWHTERLEEATGIWSPRHQVRDVYGGPRQEWRR